MRCTDGKGTWLLILCANWLLWPAACETPTPNARQTAVDLSEKRTQDEGGPRGDLLEQRASREYPSVVLAAADCGVAGSVVFGAVREQLSQRGVRVQQSCDDPATRLVLVAVADWKPVPSWRGDLPACELSLNYSLLGLEDHQPILSRRETVQWSEQSREQAVFEAVQRAADSAAELVVNRLAGLELPDTPRPSDSTTTKTSSLACLRLHNASARQDQESLCDEFAGLATTAFQRAGRYRVVERSQVNELLAEQDLGQALGGEPAQARRVGTLLEADILVVGELTSDSSGSISVAARMVQATTGEVLKTSRASGSADRARLLLESVARDLAQPIPEWVQDCLRQLCDRRR